MKEKFAIVVGSSSGLGFSITEYLLDEGYNVFGVSRRGTSIEHGKFFDIPTDIRDELSVESLVEEVSMVTQEIDICVLSAGVCQIDPIIETSSKEFINHLMTNAIGPFHILKHLQPFLIPHTSHIISISSEAGQRGFAGWGAFSSSKFALEGLLQSCEIEWKDLGVRFTTLRPGGVDTKMWDKLDMDIDREKLMTMEEFIDVFSLVVKNEKTWFKNLNFNNHV